MGVRKFALSTVGVALLAGSASAGIQMTDHYIIGDLHGDWTLENQAFVPASQASYGFDTLLVEEHVPGYIWPDDTAGMRVDDSGRPAERWADLWVTVTRDSTRGDSVTSMIAFDKSVTNWTTEHWTDFHVEVGVGLHENFAGVPGLDFKLDPPPAEEDGFFPNPPMYGVNPDNWAPSLWWDINQPPMPISENGQYPGVWPEETARFWFAINIPDMLFAPISGGGEAATIVIRQHWTPTPGAAGAMAMAFGAMGIRRRRSN